MRGRRRKSGFSLIEILIAMVVMVIGIVGVLAVFPVGIRTTQESSESTRAAIIGLSVHDALTVAVHAAAPELPGTRTPATMYHDGLPGEEYVFDMPSSNELYSPGPPESNVLYYPLLGEGTNDRRNLFRLAISPGVAETVYDTRDNYDHSESYAQYEFAFDVLRRRQPDNTVPPLYEFRVHIFRAYYNDPSWGDNRARSGWRTLKHPSWVKTFVFMIAGN